MAQAKELDAYYEKNGKTVGPLHGLPISLKDQFRIKVGPVVLLLPSASLTVKGARDQYGLRGLDREVRQGGLCARGSASEGGRCFLHQDKCAPEFDGLRDGQ